MKGAFPTPVCARRQTNGPPGIDQGIYTGSCKGRHALSAGAVHPPSSRPLSASAELLFKTDCAH